MRPAVRRALVAATAAGLWTVVGCTATVTPPRTVAQPATVHSRREAMHTGLVLPPATDGAGFVEFGYGEWEWFARGNDAWYRVFPTVLWPTMGTLGAPARGGRRGGPAAGGMVGGTDAPRRRSVEGRDAAHAP
ncbi:MAG: hypothetical protein FJ306_07500 [Planctomycetes bacterium]|nr:hypothetical protein [Planctomycetota bacterium]